MGACCFWVWALTGFGAGAYGAVVFSELMYHPLEEEGVEGSELEFLELLNTGSDSVDLSGAWFDEGITFVFPEGSLLEAGAFIVLASNADAFAGRYENVSVFGEYEGQLSNGGETITLVDSSGELLFSVDYGDSSPWPVEADGLGKSLVLSDPTMLPSSPSDYTAWKASSDALGSPGVGEVVLQIVEVLINEILSHTDLPDVDSVEIYNPNASDANIGGWYLSDNYEEPKLYQLPEGSVVPTGGFLVIDETEFGAGDSGFRLDSHGETVWLFSADEAGELSGYSHGVSFGASANGVSFGRVVTSEGIEEWVAMESLTLGEANSDPLLGQLVFSEIMYEPVAGGIEYVELINTSDEPAALYDLLNPNNTWRIQGLDFSFPEGLTVQPSQLVIVANVEASAFRDYYGSLDGVMILGPYTGALNNSGESLTLLRPDSPDLVEGEVFVPYIEVDGIEYDSEGSWPTGASGLGPSIEKQDRSLMGREPLNWSLSLSESGSPGWVRGMDFEVWQRSWFSNEELTLGSDVGAADDFDGDGESNLWEYATGSSGRTGDRVGGPQAWIGEEADEAYLGLSVVQSLYPADVDWALFRSEGIDALSVWEEGAFTIVESMDLGDGRQRLRIADTGSFTASETVFLRLETSFDSGD